MDVGALTPTIASAICIQKLVTGGMTTPSPGCGLAGASYHVRVRLIDLSRSIIRIGIMTFRFAAATALCTAAAAAFPLTAMAEDAGTPAPTLTPKLNAYVGCINRLSERSFQSRERYFSWVNKDKGPTGKERIIYGTYTIYETSDCKAGVEKANALEPHDADLEAAASAYAAAVGALEPLLKEADDYYTQENYKDDKMNKGKELHPRLVAAWNAFAAADAKLRTGIETIQDKMDAENLAEIEKAEGRKDKYHVQALMIRAKRLVRIETGEKPDTAKVTEALTSYEDITKAAEAYSAANKDTAIGSGFINDAKSFLTSAKQLMRRLRDKVPYSTGDKMMLQGGGGWMVEGSPPRLLRDYNQLVESYNRGSRF